MRAALDRIRRLEDFELARGPTLAREREDGIPEQVPPRSGIEQYRVMVQTSAPETPAGLGAARARALVGTSYVAIRIEQQIVYRDQVVRLIPADGERRAGF